MLSVLEKSYLHTNRTNISEALRHLRRRHIQASACCAWMLIDGSLTVEAPRNELQDSSTTEAIWLICSGVSGSRKVMRMADFATAGSYPIANNVPGAS